MLEQNFDYKPKKRRALRIIAQIVLTLFTAAMIGGLIVCFTSDAPQYIPFEDVNLYNTNYCDVYELKDLKIISKYSSDEDFNYYLVLLPYNDEMPKVASFRCGKYYFDDYDDENKDMAGFVFTAGATVSTIDMDYDNIQEAYNRAVDNLKNNGMKVVSTELAFTFACEANDADFSDYYDVDKSGTIFSIVFLTILSIAGIALMIISFKNSNCYDQGQIYYVPGYNKTSLDYDFDKRF